jgi:CheY-like chemotaxis protein
MTLGTPITILLADDDAEDRQLVRDALLESRLHNDLKTVNDGEELLDYLRRRGEYISAGATTSAPARTSPSR